MDRAAADSAPAQTNFIFTREAKDRLTAAMALEGQRQVFTVQTQDHPEMVRVFHEKRGANYQDK